MSECKHKWLPLIEMNENGAPCGSLGSQIGYRCNICGTSEILWPKMAARTEGLTEEKLMKLNQRRVR